MEKILDFSQASVHFYNSKYLHLISRFSKSEDEDPVNIEDDSVRTNCHINCYAIQFLLSGENKWIESDKIPSTEIFSMHFDLDHSLIVHVPSETVYQTFSYYNMRLNSKVVPYVISKIINWKNNWEELTNTIDINQLECPLKDPTFKYPTTWSLENIEMNYQKLLDNLPRYLTI